MARLAGSLVIVAAMILWPTTPDSYCLMGEIHRNNPAWWQEAADAGKRMKYHAGYTYFYDHKDGGWYFKRGGQNISINLEYRRITH